MPVRIPHTRNTSSHTRFCRHSMWLFARTLVVMIVIMVMVLFVVTVAVFRVNDHFFVFVVLFVVMGMVGLGVNPTCCR